MELLTYPKTDYLLSSSLKSLHTESQEWLKEIDFWKDEMAFYFRILNNKNSNFKIEASEVEELQRQIIAKNQKLDEMKNKVKRHENRLAALFKSDAYQEENSYRDIHKGLLKDMYDLHLIIKPFKKQIFSLNRQD